jgi:hypothetical protein
MRNKELEKIIVNDDSYYITEDEEDLRASPCWEVRIDKETKKLLFQVDGKEVFSYPLSRIKKPLTLEKFNSLLQILRTGDLKVLKDSINE